MSKSAIPFVTDAWPIVTGCSKIGQGCTNCYAARLAATRLWKFKHYKGLAEYRDGRGHWIAPPRFNEDILTQPLRWRKPRRVFVAQTGDLFHMAINAIDIIGVWDIMGECPQHTFMVFTKRWRRASLMLRRIEKLGHPPLPNVHLVFSASTQAEVDECAPILLDTPAARRGLSLEPLLENIVLPWWTRELDFVIAGAETSLRKSLARPCPVDAPRSLLKWSREHGVPFWWKGWGAHLPDGQVKGLLDRRRYEEMV